MTGPFPKALPSAIATAPPGMRLPVKATNSPNTPPVHNNRKLVDTGRQDLHQALLATCPTSDWAAVYKIWDRVYTSQAVCAGLT